MRDLWKLFVFAGMVVTLLLTKESVSAADFDPASATETYECGSVTAYWYAGSGRMVFSGSGYVQNYDYDILDHEWKSPPPYLSFMEDIKTADFYGCFPGEYCLYGALKLTSVGLPVSSGCEEIQDYAFAQCASLSGITIPSGVKIISIAAFRGCSSLKSMVIPYGVSRLYGYVFEDCTSLESVSIPQTVTEMGTAVFSKCGSLTELTLPPGLQEIPSSFADECTGLKGIEIPTGVREIKMNAFYKCTSLTRISIPDNVSSLGSYSFSYCAKLSEIEIGSGLTSIGSHAFSCVSIMPVKTRLLTSNSVALSYDWTGDNRLLSQDGDTVWQDDYTYILDEAGRTITLKKYIGTDTEITIPETAVIGGKSYRVTALYGDFISGTFYKNETVQSVTLPDTITEIPKYCFYGCSALSNVRFPAHLTSIGSSAFYNCEALTSLTIGEELETIGASAFYVTYRNPKLDTLLASSSPGVNAYLWSSGNRNPVYPQNLLGITALSDYIYEANAADHSIRLRGYNGTAEELVIPGIVSKDGVVWSVTEIYTGTFRNNQMLRSVTIPDTVTKVWGEAFASCRNLETIIGGNGVISVGISAFSYFLYEDGEYKYKPTVLDTRSDAILQYNWTGSYRGVFYKTTSPDTEWQEDYEWYIDARTATLRLSEYIGTGTEISVPSVAVIDSVLYPVGINGNTYKDSDITTFEVEDGVLLASLYCMFQNCKMLISADFEGAVLLFDSIMLTNAFMGCSALEKVSFSGLDISNQYSSPSGVFSGCGRLKRIVVPSVTSTSYSLALPGTFYEVLPDGSFGTTGYTNLMKAPVNMVIGRTVSYFTIRLPVSVELTGENGIMSGDIPVSADTDLENGKRLVFSFSDMRLFAEHGIMFFSEVTPYRLEWTGESHNIGGNIHLVTETLEPGEYLVQLNFIISLE